MMNYEIFKEVVKEKFMDYMPEKFKGMELVAEPVEKVNVTLDGIILREEGAPEAHHPLHPSRTLLARDDRQDEEVGTARRLRDVKK